MPSCPTQPISWPCHLCLQEHSGIIHPVAAALTQVQATTDNVRSEAAKTTPPTSCSPCFPSCPPSNPPPTEQSEGCYGNRIESCSFPPRWLRNPTSWLLKPCSEGQICSPGLVLNHSPICCLYTDVLQPGFLLPQGLCTCSPPLPAPSSSFTGSSFTCYLSWAGKGGSQLHTQAKDPVLQLLQGLSPS